MHWYKCLYCSGMAKGLLFIPRPHILGFALVAYLGLHPRVEINKTKEVRRGEGTYVDRW